VETVIRLLDMGLDPFNFSDALLAVLAQRLVKRICTECKEEYHPDEDEYAELEHAFGGKEETAKFASTTTTTSCSSAARAAATATTPDTAGAPASTSCWWPTMA